ncbi:MAG TPA: cation:proton antiporter [Bryobacteraceae bacterium]|jgi:Kef-type K+ transport system membrane component KefB|nr:cation:proton antiporter [Bryobacteraceae bacterium]
MPNLVTLLLQIAAVVVTARLVGLLFRQIGQPQVVGEMVAGILLGPSFLGWVAPSLSAVLFPAASLGYLSTLSQVGLLLFMFLVGLEFDPALIRGRGRAVVLISNVSIAVPFAMGSGLALYLYPRLADPHVGFTAFTLFLGAAMSITAFPVLARILAERRLTRTDLGAMAIACAAIDDVTAWCILAYIVAFVRSTESSHLWITFVGVTVFAVAMIFVVRRLLLRFQAAFAARHKLTEDMMALLLLLLLLSAAATEFLGVHLLFGAFLFGAVLPRDHDFVRAVSEKLESVTVVLLLPVFFAFVGLRTSLQLMGGGEMWWYCLLVIVVAVVGKLAGSAVAARVAGIPWRNALAIGVLMNTRGLMQLVILNLGFELGVINQALFSMMVVMAIVTTLLTTPLLEWINPVREQRVESVVAPSKAG